MTNLALLSWQKSTFLKKDYSTFLIFAENSYLLQKIFEDNQRKVHLSNKHTAIQTKAILNTTLSAPKPSSYNVIQKVYSPAKNHYKLTDWLGNVRVVINDKKTLVNTGSVTVSYVAQPASVSE